MMLGVVAVGSTRCITWM